MNNPLDSFTVDRLELIIRSSGFEPCDWGEVFDSITFGEILNLCKIALAAKRAKAVAIAISPDLASAYLGNALVVGQKLYTTLPAPQIPDGWIKCSEKLPDDDSFVLVTNGKHTGMGAYLRDEHLEDDERWQDEHFEFINKQSKYSVTHWMPLPPNPEE